tara:strand:- start:115685 stop:116056 length:372 start_codon:yes stop_codon:yes gene_type:complete
MKSKLLIEMKKTFFIVFILTAFISCKQGEILKGEFVLYEDAAVIQTDSIIYGVIINKKAHELNEQAKQYKKAPTDMVKVEIRAKVSTQKDDKILWDNKIEIVEILNVSASNQGDNNVVKLGSK